MVADDEIGYSEWKGWNEDAFGKFSPDDGEYYFNEILSRLPPERRTDFLEIGFGNGSLLGWAKSNFTSVTGVEKSQLLVERANRHGFTAYEDLDEAITGKTLDVIVAMDVLEHMKSEDIDRLLTLVRRHLRPDGVFIARFPNGDSPFGRINQNGDDTHINALGIVKLPAFAGRSGLSLEYLGAPAIIGPKGIKDRLNKLVNKIARKEFERWMAKLYLPARIYLGMNYLAVFRNPPLAD